MRTTASHGSGNEAVRALQARLQATRNVSLQLAAPLTDEDMVVQAMDDASPAKWHLAHVTWFFETFVLKPHLPGYRVFDEDFNYCFNSYYESQGQRQPRPSRGLLTRPGCDRVRAYRAHVDENLAKLFSRGIGAKLESLIETGINHEQQHQELLLTDILSLFAANPLRPAYAAPGAPRAPGEAGEVRWLTYQGGIYFVGHDGAGFAWDNEGPRHEVLLRPFRLADGLVSNGDWLQFMSDGGYATPSLWLMEGWTTIKRENWSAPLYWEQRDGGWVSMTLSGLQPVDPAAPVAHVSYYEADAFARWAGKRLATEFEWEVAAQGVPVAGNTLSTGALRPLPAGDAGPGPRQMYGDVWEWTQSAYQAYPGYRPPAGALGEYNGKFMVSQQVLRGASCVTPDGHTRATYRNFFFPHQRWQFTGVRLADEVQ